MCVGTQKFKRNSLQQSHFRQKEEEEDEFGNGTNNGDPKHLLPKKKKSHSQNATSNFLKN